MVKFIRFNRIDRLSDSQIAINIEQIVSIQPGETPSSSTVITTHGIYKVNGEWVDILRLIREVQND